MKSFSIPATTRPIPVAGRATVKRTALILLPLLCLAVPACTTHGLGGSTGISTPIRGQLQLRITDLVEHMNSFPVLVQGSMQETGPVELTLDPADPQAQTMVLDFARMEIRIETRLMVNAPLLARLGAPPFPLAVSERGTLRITDVRRGEDGTATMAIGYRTESRGTIPSGPFAGAAYRNRKDHNHDCSFPANTVRRMTVRIDPRGSVTGAVRSAGLPNLLCAADQGSFTFGGRESAFTGSRTGAVAPLE